MNKDLNKLFGEARKMHSPIQPGEIGDILGKGYSGGTNFWKSLLSSLNSQLLMITGALISVVVLLLVFLYNPANDQPAGSSMPETPVLPEITENPPEDPQSIGTTPKSEAERDKNETASMATSPKETEDTTSKEAISDSATTSNHSVIINAGSPEKDSVLLEAAQTMMDASGMLFEHLEGVPDIEVTWPEGSLETDHGSAGSEKVLGSIDTEVNKKITSARAQIDEAEQKIEQFQRERKAATLTPEHLPKPDKEVLELLVPLRDESVRLKPAQETLRRLGITIEDQSIAYRGNIASAGNLNIRLCIDETNYKVITHDDEKQLICGVNFEPQPETYTFFPEFVTEADGRFTPFRWKFADEPMSKLTDEYVDNMMDVLIPVYVEHPNSDAPRSEWIFWFMPDEAFADIILEDARARDIYAKSGYDTTKPGSITNLAEQSTETNIPELTLEVYPNPVYEDFTVQTFTYEATVANFSLYTLDGQEVQILRSGVEIPAGKNRIIFPKPDLADGVYLLRIDTKDGSYSEYKRVLFGY